MTLPETDPLEGMEEWVRELVEAKDLNFAPFATMQQSGQTIWACMDDCACLFIIDDTTFLDRFTLLNGDGTCLDRGECACHDLPTHKPGTEDTDG